MAELAIIQAAAHWSALQWSAMLALAALGGLMHGFIGIGLPLLATPLLALIIGFQNAVIVLVAPSMAVIACTFFTYRGALAPGDSLRRFWPFLVTAPLGTYAGVRAFYALDPRLLMAMLALVVMVYLAIDRLGHVRAGAIKRHPLAFAFAFGFAGGLTEGAVNVGAPPFLIFFLLLEAPVASIIVILNFMFAVGKSIQAALLANHGAFSHALLVTCIPLSMAATAGFSLGLHLRRRNDPERYRVWLKQTLALMAVILLARAAFGS